MNNNIVVDVRRCFFLNSCNGAVIDGEKFGFGSSKKAHLYYTAITSIFRA